VADAAGPAASTAQTALGSGSVATRLRAAILALARHRGPTASICPSDAARAIGGDGWRELTAQSRTIAFDLARDGDVEITQHGNVIDADAPPRGAIRIRTRQS
jgi:hypothetical protein